MRPAPDSRRIWLVRHAKAEAGGADLPDRERDLTQRGRRQCRELASWLQPRVGQEKLLVQVSPARRTRETARLALAGLTIGPDMLRLEPRIWEASASDLLALIRSESGALMLIGHNPGLEQAQYALTGVLQAFPTAAAFELELGPRGADLVARFQPASERM